MKQALYNVKFKCYKNNNASLTVIEERWKLIFCSPSKLSEKIGEQMNILAEEINPFYNGNRRHLESKYYYKQVESCEITYLGESEEMEKSDKLYTSIEMLLFASFIRRTSLPSEAGIGVQSSDLIKWLDYKLNLK